MSNHVCRELRREVMVGTFAFSVLLGLFIFSIFVTGGIFWKRGQTIEVVFDRVMGLRKGDNVVVRGMTVGEVKGLALAKETGRIKVTCHLVEPVKLKSDCTATVIQTSVLGGRQVSLEEGAAADALAEGTPVKGLLPQDLMADLGAIVQDLRGALEKDGILEDAKVTLKNVREITDKINKGEGTLGQLVNDGSAYRDAGLAMANLKLISQRIVDGQGTLGKLLSDDDEIYGDAKLLLQDVRAAVDDYRESSPILTFTTVLFGAF